MLHLGFNIALGLFMCFRLTHCGKTSGHEVGPVTVVVAEGADAVLPCSISTKQSIVNGLFDWKKDGQKEVFMYDAGVYYNNGRNGQDKDFRGRVSHFSQQLEFGNASITINKTTIEDSGNYTCVFPRTDPRELFNINLLVERVFKDRSGESFGAAAKPLTMIANVTEAGVVLQCVVQGASPQPTLQWQDSDAAVIPAEQPQVSETRDHYDVVLQTTVTKTTTNRFYCEVKQDEIGHVVRKSIIVPEKLFPVIPESCHSVGISMFVAGLFAGVFVPLALFIRAKIIGRRKGTKGPEEPWGV